MNKVWWVLGGVVLLVVLAVVMGVSGYNKAIRLDEEANNGWAQVDNQLKRRYDLIPNLVETVKGYAGHEKEIFENLAAARTRYFSAGTPDQQVSEVPGVERALSRLMMLQETYPQLQANQNFRALMDELAGTENRIAVERKRYNDAVQALNAYCRRFPSSFYASFAGVGVRKYFEVQEAEKEAPKVKFGD